MASKDNQIKQNLNLSLPPTGELQPVTQEEQVELRAGDLCPRCRSARLDYDGLLNLACPQCGFAIGGCFT
jgi:uncharacterized protein (DUF983 family)